MALKKNFCIFQSQRIHYFFYHFNDTIVRFRCGKHQNFYLIKGRDG